MRRPRHGGGVCCSWQPHSGGVELSQQRAAAVISSDSGAVVHGQSMVRGICFRCRSCGGAWRLSSSVQPRSAAALLVSCVVHGTVMALCCSWQPHRGGVEFSQQRAAAIGSSHSGAVVHGQGMLRALCCFVAAPAVVHGGLLAACKLMMQPRSAAATLILYVPPRHGYGDLLFVAAPAVACGCRPAAHSRDQQQWCWYRASSNAREVCQRRATAISSSGAGAVCYPKARLGRVVHRSPYSSSVELGQQQVAALSDGYSGAVQVVGEDPVMESVVRGRSCDGAWRSASGVQQRSAAVELVPCVCSWHGKGVLLRIAALTVVAQPAAACRWLHSAAATVVVLMVNLKARFGRFVVCCSSAEVRGGQSVACNRDQQQWCRCRVLFQGLVRVLVVLRSSYSGGVELSQQRAAAFSSRHSGVAVFQGPVWAFVVHRSWCGGA